MQTQKSNLTLIRLHMLKECGHEVVDEFLHGISTYVTQEDSKLKKQVRDIQEQPSQEGVDKDWLEYILSEDHYFLDEAKKLSHELAIVALYKKIEITTKHAVEAAYPDVSPKSLFKIKDLKKALENKGIELVSLQHYSAMDETRCLNNDIKHEGKVGKELSQYPNWKKGELLLNLDAAYSRLAPLCSLYMNELIDAIIQKQT